MAESFFFSSRRRHTISLCDWSSDVCSSDLSIVLITAALMLPGQPPRTSDAAERLGQSLVADRGAFLASQRSEERRVGKECRSRGSREDSKYNNGEDGYAL